MRGTNWKASQVRTRKGRSTYPVHCTQGNKANQASETLSDAQAETSYALLFNPTRREREENSHAYACDPKRSEELPGRSTEPRPAVRALRRSYLLQVWYIFCAICQRWCRFGVGQVQKKKKTARRRVLTTFSDARRVPMQKCTETSALPAVETSASRPGGGPAPTPQLSPHVTWP